MNALTTHVAPRTLAVPTPTSDVQPPACREARARHANHERPRATRASQEARFSYDGERHSTFAVTLSYSEAHLINRVREMVAAEFLLKVRNNGELPQCHRKLEAMDILCDQLGLADMPNRLRARDAGARDPMGPEEVARFLGVEARQ